MSKKGSHRLRPLRLELYAIFVLLSAALGSAALAGDALAAPGNKHSSKLTMGTRSIAAAAGSQAAGGELEKLAQAEARMMINAPPEIVWKALTDFPQYPQIFRRLESCRIIKQQGNLVWTESDLKPHMFVRKPRQHTVNDLSGKPHVLDWKLLDGNFKTVFGKWRILPAGTGDRCEVIYTLAVDPGPLIPKFLVAFTLKNLQREIVASLKEWVESTQSATPTSARANPPVM